MSHLKFNNFENAFTGIIQHIKANGDVFPSRNGDMYENLSLSYEVSNPKEYQFENENKGRIPYTYAEDFYSWMVNGSNEEDTSKLAEKYPHTKGFLAKPKSSHLPENFNAFYGHRLNAQLPFILKELSSTENSRRAVINILDADDLLLLDAPEDSNLEFPCCNSVTFSVRDNKLHTHVHMRSNNMGNVAKLDMYIWGRFQCELAELLKVDLGTFNCSIVSAHIFTTDFEYFKSVSIL